MVYLITGGAGSLGKALAAHLLTLVDTDKVILYSRDEHKHYVARLEIADERVRTVVGDVRDYDALHRVLGQGVDAVIHAAALKRVEVCEYNPLEAIATNINGSANVIRACRERGVKRCVAVSTDKAVEPVTLYGCTKAVMERMFLAACVYAPIFRVVRYGNVMTSRGAILPQWLEARRRGEPLKVTSMNMTRFWLDMPDAIRLVMYALQGEPQVTYVAKAPSASIARIVEAMRPCEVDIIGARQGEKLHEVMYHMYESGRTYDCGDHYEILPEEWYDGPKHGYWPSLTRMPPWEALDSYSNKDWLTPEQIRERIARIEVP